MNTLVDLFNLGMLRNFPDILPDKNGIVLNLGPGNKHIDGAIELEWPQWNAEKDKIPFDDNTVDMIHCYHFLEHIKNVHFVLNEINRVLKPGCHINIVVPYYNTLLQIRDLDHKTAFTEQTWNVLYDDSYYVKNKLNKMHIHFNMIMGEKQEYLALITQLVKL